MYLLTVTNLLGAQTTHLALFGLIFVIADQPNTLHFFKTYKKAIS